MGGGAGKQSNGQVVTATTASLPAANQAGAQAAAEEPPAATGVESQASGATSPVTPASPAPEKPRDAPNGARRPRPGSKGGKKDGETPVSTPSNSQQVAHALPGAAPEAKKAEPAKPEPAAPVSTATIQELIKACREGDVAAVRTFVSRGLGGEAYFDEYGDSALHHAVHAEQEAVLEALLESASAQLPADVPNAQCETALQVACRKGHACMVSRLLRARADPDHRDSRGFTAFLAAVYAGANEELMKMLLHASADVDAQDSRGVGALHFGALRGEIKLLEWLISHNANVNIQTEHGTTPLMLAAKRGHLEAVSLLLEARANTALADEAGSTALMQVLAAGNLEAATKLFDAGASLDAVDGAGRGPLFHAVFGGDVGCLQAVISRGGRVNMLDEEGRSPLYQACLMGATKLVEVLLGAGADPNLAGRGTTVRPLQEDGESQEDNDAENAARMCLSEARTCLQVSVALTHNSLIPGLMANGADVNAAPGALGWTPLHLCAAVGNEEATKLLLANGAECDFEDSQGNTAESLAERAGQEKVSAHIKKAAAAAPPKEAAEDGKGQSRSQARLGKLPPLAAVPPEEKPAEEEHEPLAVFEQEWQKREPNDTLLDRICGPMVHDALQDENWKVRWEAVTFLTNNFGQATGKPGEIVAAVSEVLASTARDKMSKVFLASLGLLEVLLGDQRIGIIEPEEFTAMLRGRQMLLPVEDALSTGEGDALMALLDQTDAAGGSNVASSPQQAAAEAICQCVRSKHLPIDEVAWPLLTRIQDRLRSEALGGEGKDKKEAALIPKCLAANLKFLAQLLATFGLKHNGLFRRALVVPLLLRSASNEHSRVRAAAGEALAVVVAKSGGGLDESLWRLLPVKRRKGLQQLLTEREGAVSPVSQDPCGEDVLAKNIIVAEDARAGGFVCVSDMTPHVWEMLEAGKTVKEASEQAQARPVTSCGPAGGGVCQSSPPGVVDDVKSEALRAAVGSKAWKERVDGVAVLQRELVASTQNVAHLIEGAVPGENLHLSQYVICGHQVSSLQASLATLLSDNVSGVFLAAADILLLLCGRMPPEVAVQLIEPAVGPLVSRLPDTSGKVRSKASETLSGLAALHKGALSETVVCGVTAGATNGLAVPQTPGGGGGAAAREGEKSAGARLQLLATLLPPQDQVDMWSEDTWRDVVDFAARTAEHKSNEVRKEAAVLLKGCSTLGGRAAVAANEASARQQATKRPGTSSGRPGTAGAARPAAAAAAGPPADVSQEDAAAALQRAATSKNWKERADAAATLAARLASTRSGMQRNESERGKGTEGDDDLSQFNISGLSVSALQVALVALLGDSVTAVFVAAADLTLVTCSQLVPDLVRGFLEPLLAPLLAHLSDTSSKVRSKAADVAMQLATCNRGAFGEMVVQHATGTGQPAGSSDPKGSRESDRSMQPRLQLLVRLTQQVASRDTAGSWTDDAWQALADFALRAAEHRNGEVRKEAANLLNSMGTCGDRAAAVSDEAVVQLRALAQEKMCKRPGTGSVRLGTASTRVSTTSWRQGTQDLGGTGKLSNLGSTGRLSNLGSTGRLSTGARPRTGSRARPYTGRQREQDEESDNSLPEDGPKAVAEPTEADGVKFYDVQTACPGADAVPDAEEGEAALNEALQLAESLTEEGLSDYAAIVALFGEGWVRCFCSRHWQCRVAAVTHFASQIGGRIEQCPRDAMPDLLDGSMRVVYEGLGDQNVRVYAEACMAVTVAVPAFVTMVGSKVDGRLLLAQLAPLLRQLCTRMGDLKEVVRTQTTQALFRLIRPPTGDLLSPRAVVVLLLRNASQSRDEEAASSQKAPPSRGAATGWLCRLAALRDIVKEFPKESTLSSATDQPGEWLALQEGLAHNDATVRHEAARLFALACKLHVRSLGDEDAQRPSREAWAAALRLELPAKSVREVRQLLKLAEKAPGEEVAAPAQTVSKAIANTAAWDVPDSLAFWAACHPGALAALRSPGDPEAVVQALNKLAEGAANYGESKHKDGVPDEAFAGICRAIQHVLGSKVGGERSVFLSTVALCQAAVTNLAPALSGLDINIGLTKIFPTLMERTSMLGVTDVKLGVASDKLVQQLAKHPKVGAEAVTKMVIGSVSRSERPMRPLVLLRTLLNDFGLRLCAQRDIVGMLLGAIGEHLERLSGPANDPDDADTKTLRPQLVGVLSTCNQFSAETVQFCLREIEPAQRKLLLGALQEAPDARLIALGAAAAEAEEIQQQVHAAGSGIRALSRSNSSSRAMSPSKASSVGSEEAVFPARSISGTRRQLPRPEDSPQRRTGTPPPAESSPARKPRRRVIDCPVAPPGDARSGASTAASTEYSSGSGEYASPYAGSLSPARQQQQWKGAASSPFSRSGENPLRPPAPLGLSTALKGGRSSQGGSGEDWGDRDSAEKKKKSRGKEKGSHDSLGALMDVLSQMEPRDNGRQRR